MPIALSLELDALLFRTEESPYQTASNVNKAVITTKTLQMGIFLRRFYGQMIVPSFEILFIL
jgi:hypothetical protein